MSSCASVYSYRTMCPIKLKYVAMKIWPVSLLLIATCIGAAVQADEAITKDEAVAVAERFIQEQGYTHVPATVKGNAVVLESITWSEHEEDLFRQRFNSLHPRAIGIKRTDHPVPGGWGVAFDYVTDYANEDICRVVTMNADGTNLRVQHVEGARSYWIGLDE